MPTEDQELDGLTYNGKDNIFVASIIFFSISPFVISCKSIATNFVWGIHCHLIKTLNNDLSIQRAELKIRHPQYFIFCIAKMLCNTPSSQYLP